MRPTSPSSNRTCGFPASGSPESSRLRHSQVSPAWPFGTASPSDKRVSGFLRSGTYIVQAALPSSRLKLTSSKAPLLHGHYPASQLLWASPTPGRDHTCSYVFPQAVGSSLPSRRVSQVPRLIFQRTPSPHTPESPEAAFSHSFTSDAGFTISGRLAALTCLSRPKRVRSRYGLRLCRSRLRQVGLLRPTLDWLHS